MNDYLTKEESLALSDTGTDKPGDTTGDADRVSGSSEEPAEQAPQEEAQAQDSARGEEDRAPEGGDDLEVLTKDGKHYIPYDVLKSIREENRALKEQLESLRKSLEAPRPEPVEVRDDRIIRGDDGEEYVPLEKATLEELLAARAQKLAEGDYTTVNAIDLRIIDIKQREAMAYAEFSRSQAAFAAKNPWYGTDPILTRIADSIILELDADPAWKGKSFDEGWAEVGRRLSKYVGQDTQTARTEEQPVRQVRRVVQRPPNTTSLSGVPNAGVSSGDDRWAQLDALAQTNPEAYELAVMELSPQAYREYINRR